MKNGVFSCYKKNRRITIKEKLEIIEYAKKKGNQEAANKAGVSTKAIRRWKKNESQFLEITDPLKRITLHPGRIEHKMSYALEKEIYDWVTFNRSLGNPVTTWAIGIQMLKKEPSYKNVKPKSLLMAVYRFMERNNLSLRTASHVGQELPNDTVDRIYMFLKSVINKRKLYDIDSNHIVNMDETALQLNMPSNKTVHKVGAKTIYIRTQNQEKIRVSVILSCCANGDKLKPYVIYKGGKKGKIFNSLQKEELVKTNKIVIATNANAWATNDIIKDWLDKVYISYFKNYPLEKTLLIWDNATMHNSIATLKYLYNKKINVVFIPKGLTSILQPLDTSLNRPFKDWIKRSYEEAVSLFNDFKGAKIKREVILNWIYTNWFDNEKIKIEIIKNAFLYCGISNNMDGSEDELFNGFNLINERGFIEDDFNDEDKEDMNNDIKVQDSDISSMGSSDEELEKESGKGN